LTRRSVPLTDAALVLRVLQGDTRLLYGDNVIIAADTQLIGRAREIIRSL
jgi:hypothetical protein